MTPRRWEIKNLNNIIKILLFDQKRQQNDRDALSLTVASAGIVPLYSMFSRVLLVLNSHLERATAHASAFVYKLSSVKKNHNNIDQQ